MLRNRQFRKPAALFTLKAYSNAMPAARWVCTVLHVIVHVMRKHELAFRYGILMRGCCCNQQTMPCCGVFTTMKDIDGNMVDVGLTAMRTGEVVVIHQFHDSRPVCPKEIAEGWRASSLSVAPLIRTMSFTRQINVMQLFRPAFETVSVADKSGRDEGLRSIPSRARVKSENCVSKQRALPRRSGAARSLDCFPPSPPKIVAVFDARVGASVRRLCTSGLRPCPVIQTSHRSAPEAV